MNRDRVTFIYIDPVRYGTWSVPAPEPLQETSVSVCWCKRLWILFCSSTAAGLCIRAALFTITHILSPFFHAVLCVDQLDSSLLGEHNTNRPNSGSGTRSEDENTKPIKLPVVWCTIRRRNLIMAIIKLTFPSGVWILEGEELNWLKLLFASKKGKTRDRTAVVRARAAAWNDKTERYHHQTFKR